MKKTGYMDSVDYEYHLEHDFYPVPVYTSVAALKREKICCKGKKSCGIYKVSISIDKVIKKEKIGQD